jgi:class 3 adenylate cyclase
VWRAGHARKEVLQFLRSCAGRGGGGGCGLRGKARAGSRAAALLVLFCDLVGFTPLSESRDPEAVRELLPRYFMVARTVIDRSGGVVEKFIGDAVMAVWGTPVAGKATQNARCAPAWTWWPR